MNENTSDTIKRALDNYHFWLQHRRDLIAEAEEHDRTGYPERAAEARRMVERAELNLRLAGEWYCELTGTESGPVAGEEV